MALATNYYETMALNPLRGIPVSAPTALYVAQYLTVPDESGAGVEVSGGGYQRMPVTLSEPETKVDGSVGCVNTTQILYPTATEAWGTVLAAALFDSQTGGNMLVRIPYVTPKEIVANTTLSYVAGELEVIASSLATTYWKTAVLNILRGESIEALTATSIALFTSDPGNAGGGMEVSASDYVRQTLTFAAPTEQATGNMLMANSTDISFARTGTQWGTITHFGIMSAQTGGIMLYRGEANPAVTVSASDRWSAAAGQIRIMAS